MGCNLSQYRASIGLFYGGLSGASLFFNFNKRIMKIQNYLCVKSNRNLLLFWVVSLWLSILLLKCGDIHLNPGPTCLQLMMVMYLCIMFRLVDQPKCLKNVYIVIDILYGDDSLFSNDIIDLLIDVPTYNDAAIHKLLYHCKVLSLTIQSPYNILISVVHFLLKALLLLCGDVHINPGPKCNTGNVLRICHCNIRSLNCNDKIDHIKADLVGKYDVISLSETWLKSSVDNDIFKILGYGPPHRKDRYTDSGYGGVMAWVSQEIYCKRMEIYEIEELEILWLELTLYNVKLLLGVCYRPPNTKSDWWLRFDEMLNLISDNYSGHILITGDFNSDPKTPNFKKLCEICSTYDLHTHIDEPTHISGSILDQFISNCECFINKTEVEDQVSTNDHYTIGIRLNFKTPKRKSFQRLMWNFNNLNNYNEALENTDFSFCDDITDLNETVHQFSDKLYEIALNNIPSKLVTVRPADKIWYNNNLRKLLRKKKRIHKQAKILNTNMSWQKF